MNELEINKAVAEKLGLAHKVKDTEFLVVPEGHPPLFFMATNYCNNPADAWPIIVEHEFCIQPLPAGRWQVYKIFGAYHYDKNPLKAAMLCFLEMEIQPEVHKSS